MRIARRSRESAGFGGRVLGGGSFGGEVIFATNCDY